MLSLSRTAVDRYMDFPSGPPPAPETFVDHTVGTDSMGGEIFASDVNGEPMTLVESVDHEALAYRAWGTPIGEFLAEQMERVAFLVRFTGATTPREYADRVEVLELGLREEAFDRGYAEGSASNKPLTVSIDPSGHRRMGLGPFPHSSF